MRILQLPIFLVAFLPLLSISSKTTSHGALATAWTPRQPQRPPRINKTVRCWPPRIGGLRQQEDTTTPRTFGGNFHIFPTALNAALPQGYQEYGNEAILRAARVVGASKDHIDIQWKSGRIVVTVTGGNVYVSDDPVEKSHVDDDAGKVTPGGLSPHPDAVDLMTLAKAINSALDYGTIGVSIAETHSIEVTTPGAGEVLSSDIMFESYKGYDVLCTYVDPKKGNKKQKTIQGRLVERNDEHLVLNMKGRMKKIRLEDLVEVRLPKSKNENKRNKAI